MTQVRRNLCFSCYERGRPRERKSLAICKECGRSRLAYHRCGLCPACYEQQRRSVFKCGDCKREVEAPASFAVMQTCPRCWSRNRIVEHFLCPECGETKRSRPVNGVCRACHQRRQVGTATCRVCGHTRMTEMDGSGRCKACRSLEGARRRGVPPANPPELPEVTEARLVALLAPLRRSWVWEFLETGYRRRSPKTRQACLRALAGFDRYLSEQTDIGGGQWSLVTLDEVHGFLAGAGRFALQPAKAYLTWLRSRKKVERPIARALPKRSKPLRLKLLSTEQAAASYGKWTAPDSDPRQALVALLALVHCLRSGEIRALQLSDVIGNDRLSVGEKVAYLAEPVAEALARYLRWRAERYGGPSSYLLVSRASRLHDRPVSAYCLQTNILGGTSVSSLRQTAIQNLIHGAGCDGLQLASYTRLSLDAAGVYMRAFGAPVPWPAVRAR